MPDAMKKSSFPLVALGVGLALMGLLLFAGNPGDETRRILPLLTLLIISEFGMFLSGIGAWLGIVTMRATGFRPAMLSITVACAVLAAVFLILGIEYWPL
jgi:hypothetical protein